MDREKVESELQSALKWCQQDDNPNGSIAVKIWAVRDALALLKEQEPVHPEKQNDGAPGAWASWWYVCGNCGRDIDYYDKFCRSCGREVKWDD